MSAGNVAISRKAGDRKGGERETNLALHAQGIAVVLAYGLLPGWFVSVLAVFIERSTIRQYAFVQLRGASDTCRAAWHPV